MTEPEKKKPYTPPTITRVVLRREQAILSGCSASQPLLGSAAGSVCVPGPASCRKSPNPTVGDNADNS